MDELKPDEVGALIEALENDGAVCRDVELPSWARFVPPFADGIPHLTEPGHALAQSLKRESELRTAMMSVAEWCDQISRSALDKGGQQVGIRTPLQQHAASHPSTRREFREYADYILRVLSEAIPSPPESGE
jgi:hypothetical protein